MVGWLRAIAPRAHCHVEFRPNADRSLTTGRARPPMLGVLLIRTLDMSLNPESKYPSRRTFVVKLRSDAKPGSLAGRVENVVTGQQCEFASGRELLDSIATDLAADDAKVPHDQKA